PDEGQRPLVVGRDVGPLKQVASGARAVEAAEDVHEGRLAAAARAHYGQEVAAVDFDADASERVDARFAEDVELVDVLDADDGAFCRCRRLRRFDGRSFRGRQAKSSRARAWSPASAAWRARSGRPGHRLP